jgi:predicted anti-sigma-YlaC factor YlaD
MNSRECHDFLQRRLDGPSPGERQALDRHLAICPHCREWHHAAQLLTEGVEALPPVVPPPGLTDRIVASVLAERRVRFLRRRWSLTAAAAACLFITPVAVSLLGLLADRGAGLAPVALQKPSVPAAPSLERSMAEAGAAVSELTDRIAGQTRKQAQLLLTAATPREIPAALPDLGALQAPLDPAARSLWQAGEGVSAGVETVAGSARRAAAYLVQELPPLGNGRGTFD